MQDSELLSTLNSDTTGVSVVIPFRDRGEMVLRCLQSVAAQSVMPDAVILVDNGSAAETTDAVRGFIQQTDPAGVRWKLLREEKPGAPHARNCGLAAVATPWVMFFDSDDIMGPDHIKSAIATARRNPQAELIGWDVESIFSDGTRMKRSFVTTDMQYHNLFHAIMATQRYMVHMDVVRKAGGWTNVPIWNDIELGARILVLNPKVAKRPGQPQVFQTVNADSISGLTFSSRGNSYDAALAALGKTLGPKRRNWIGLKGMILAADFTKEGHADGVKRRNTILSHTDNAFARLLLSAAYTYTAAGGRGIARLLRPFM